MANAYRTTKTVEKVVYEEVPDKVVLQLNEQEAYLIRVLIGSASLRGFYIEGDSIGKALDSVGILCWDSKYKEIRSKVKQSASF